MNIHELLNNVLWVLLGSGICLYALGLKLWGPSGPESGFIPFVVGLIIGGIGLFLLASEVVRKSGKERIWESSTAKKRILYVLLAFFAMALFMETLGFILTSTLVLFFLLQLLERRRWLGAFLFASICSLTFYLFFSSLFNIHLPKGPLAF